MKQRHGTLGRVFSLSLPLTAFSSSRLFNSPPAGWKTLEHAWQGRICSDGNVGEEMTIHLDKHDTETHSGSLSCQKSFSSSTGWHLARAQLQVHRGHGGSRTVGGFRTSERNYSHSNITKVVVFFFLHNKRISTRPPKQVTMTRDDDNTFQNMSEPRSYTRRY